ncbi:MAG: hypothetical protein LiPW15_155 [Parcubacteria group bacterium LiPW_15]|nr:MAG: hypothetical protein LiPW15_155 [Parcubacteria group bacterium LiPW_15]
MAKQHIHFVGIGGIGMSALARYYLAQNWAVFGSDVEKSIITSDLIKDGISVKIGQKKENISPIFDRIIKSQAVQETNPEILEARRLGLKVFSYPEAVGELTKDIKTIAIAGAHGKSTTTAMIAKILVDAKLDPMVILGAKFDFFDGRNFRLGKNYLVLEADEFGRAFLNYYPTHTVILNIDREHLDIYSGLKDIKDTFLRFISQTKPGGILILNRDDKNIFSLKNKIEKIALKNKLKIIWFSYSDKIQAEIFGALPIPGRQNRTDAIAAYNLALSLKVSKKKILESLSGYPGLWRRMEHKGPAFDGRATVFDDYAHHPSEIKATLSAFREKYPDSPILCVFKPHQASRLKILFRDFLNSFSAADKIIILPTYIVLGRDIDEKVLTAKKLAEDLAKKYPTKKIVYLSDSDKLKSTLYSLLSAANPKPSVIIMMGAGSIANLTKSILN